MPVYTVVQVVGSKQFSGSYGPMMSYTIDIDGDDGYQGTVEHNRKEGSRAPVVGEMIDGHIEPGKGNFPPKLKKNFQQQGSGFQQVAAQVQPAAQTSVAGQPPIAPSSPPVRPPQTRSAPARGNDQQDSIERQVAFKCAAEIVAAVWKPHETQDRPMDFLKQNLTELFNHGLALIQNTNVQSEEPAGLPPLPDPEQEIPIADIRSGYAAWMERQQDPASAKMVWANKLTSLGLTENDLPTANLDQRKIVRDFLNGT